jgi:nucleotide-binding universal stress UspA family protein
MNARPTILCPVDFSDPCRDALRHARLIAEHFRGRLILLTVEDPLLTEAIQLARGISWNPEETQHELAGFAARTFHGNALSGIDVDFEVAVGNPAKQILQLARKEAADLIVMSTHGLTGARKLFFGSTTERVLRETSIPVLATAGKGQGPETMEDLKRAVRRILVPVDLSHASIHHVQVAAAIADGLQLPLVVTHVVEPVRSPLAVRLHLPSIELERRARAEDALVRLIAVLPSHVQADGLVGYGDPAEEISKIARDRQAGLIVIGLQGSPMLGARMGSVTYRALCLSSCLVLAIPPESAAARSQASALTGAVAGI